MSEHGDAPLDGEREHHGRRHELFEAAIEAEFDTPPREPTRQAAKANLVKRVVRLTAGIVVIILGLLMLALPGPGLVALAIGLALIAEDVPFARRLLDRVKARIPADESGSVSPWVWVFSGGALVVSAAGTLWWYVWR